MANNKCIRIAFVKFGGLAAGGSERWLQMMAANLPNKKFDIDYFYCDSAPYIGSDYVHADTDESRVKFMINHGVKLIKFTVKAKDITKPTHDWVETNFWDLFNPNNYDLVQTAKAGHSEYPYFMIPLPIVEYVTLGAGVDKSPNILSSIHLSNWQRNEWVRLGGDLSKSEVIPIPAEEPCTNSNLRAVLGIKKDAIIAGFHQRVDNNIFSPIPLLAFKEVFNNNYHFIIMGGGSKYIDQANSLNLKNIHFIDHSGDRSRISQFLNTLDIFAHGRSDGETFGTVFAEAMMHKLPCISHKSDIANAQPETIGPSGYFANNFKEYCFYLNLLFHDPIKRKRLGKKGKAHSLKYYSVKSCVNALAKIYYDLLNFPNEVETSIKSYANYFYCSDQYLKFVYDQSHIFEESIKNKYEVFNNKIYQTLLISKELILSLGVGDTNFLCIAMVQKKKSSLFIDAYEYSIKKFNLAKNLIYINNWEDNFSLFRNNDDKNFNKKYDLVRIDNADIKDYLSNFSDSFFLESKPLIIIENNSLTSDNSGFSKIQSILHRHDYYFFKISSNYRVYNIEKSLNDNYYLIVAVIKESKDKLLKDIKILRRRMFIDFLRSFLEMIYTRIAAIIFHSLRMFKLRVKNLF